jgi:hypothetical protein
MFASVKKHNAHVEYIEDEGQLKEDEKHEKIE